MADYQSGDPYSRADGRLVVRRRREIYERIEDRGGRKGREAATGGGTAQLNATMTSLGYCLG